MDNRKLRILCLHGFRQSQQTFKQKLGFLRKMLKPYAELIFINAPHSFIPKNGDILTPTNDEENTEEGSWWFTGPNQIYVSRTPSDTAEGFEKSLKAVQEYVKENGPYDGLLGFSQGAAFAGLISILFERKEFEADFKFVILFAGFVSLCKPHLNYYNTMVNLPSLHVIGDTDDIISKERSDDLAKHFINPEIVRHPGGHYVPGGKELKEHYINFLKKFIIKSF